MPCPRLQQVPLNPAPMEWGGPVVGGHACSLIAELGKITQPKGYIVHAFEGDGGKTLFFHNPRLYRAETSTPKEYVARLKAVREGSCKWQEARACRPPWMDGVIRRALRCEGRSTTEWAILPHELSCYPWAERPLQDRRP